MNLVRQFTEAIRSAQATKTSAYDTSATVTRIEGSTAWVHIPGGVDETPVKLTIDAKPGDTVQVRVGGGKAWLTGNATAPPTDDTKANQVADSVGEVTKVVRAVEGVASKASKIATNLNQYFWFVESGSSGENGAHITQVPADDFLADPSTGGGNLLATSSGIAIRDGQTDMAVFSADGLQVYSDTDTQVEIAHLGYGQTTGLSGTGYAPYYDLGTRDSAYAIGAYSLAAGEDCAASMPGAVALGLGTCATNGGQVAVGNYNAEDADAEFIVGNGTADDARSTVFKVGSDGSVQFGTLLQSLGDTSIASIDDGTVTGAIDYLATEVSDLSDTLTPVITTDTVDTVGNVPTETNVTVGMVTLDKGTYLLQGVCKFASNSTGRRNLHFATSADGSAASVFCTSTTPAGDGVVIMQTTWIKKITSNSTSIYLVAYHNAGTTLAITNCGITALKLG